MMTYEQQLERVRAIAAVDDETYMLDRAALRALRAVLARLALAERVAKAALAIRNASNDREHGDGIVARNSALVAYERAVTEEPA